MAENKNSVERMDNITYIPLDSIKYSSATFHVVCKSYPDLSIINSEIRR